MHHHSPQRQTLYSFVIKTVGLLNGSFYLITIGLGKTEVHPL